MNKVIVLLGASHGTGIDYVEFKSIIPKIKYDVMAIGMDSIAAIFKPEIQYFATYHSEDLKKMIERRKENDGNMDFKTICCEQIKEYPVDIVIPFDFENEKSGSSALLGVYGAQQLGYKKIILCGCPLEGENKNGTRYKSFQKGWLASKKLEKEKVRSMSGWTKEFLGAPTREWIKD